MARSDLQLVTRRSSYQIRMYLIQSRFYSSIFSLSAAATATPLKNLNHTHAGPRGSTSYHQFSAIDRPDCRT